MPQIELTTTIEEKEFLKTLGKKDYILWHKAHEKALDFFRTQYSLEFASRVKAEYSTLKRADLQRKKELGEQFTKALNGRLENKGTKCSPTILYPKGFRIKRKVPYLICLKTRTK